jgi:hypothetical protein
MPDCFAIAALTTSTNKSTVDCRGPAPVERALAL